MRPNPQETVDLVTFTKEILNGKLIFCAVADMDVGNMKFVSGNLLIVCT